MNDRSTTPSAEAAASSSPELRATLAAPGAPRAMLVRLADGALQATPVAPNCSVLDLDTDLEAHLSAEPRSDEFLISLRDYCQARLDVRAEVRRAGGLAVPAAGKAWAVMGIPGMQSLEVYRCA